MRPSSELSANHPVDPLRTGRRSPERESRRDGKRKSANEEAASQVTHTSAPRVTSIHHVFPKEAGEAVRAVPERGAAHLALRLQTTEKATDVAVDEASRAEASIRAGLAVCR